MPYANGYEPQVGDVVRVVACPGGQEPPIGQEGEVLRATRGHDVQVRFEGWVENGHPCGHGLGGLCLDGRFGWHIPASRLESTVAFYLVEPHEGAFRPIPDGPTFSDGKRAADRAKQLSAERGVRIQVRPIAKDIATSGWREREERRLTDGTYAPMPRGWDLTPIDGHYIHLAKEDLRMVAFTESPEKGVLDRQTRLTPGRYLERFYGDLSETRRAHCIAFVDKPDTVHFTTSADRIEWVYRNGPHSCMSKDPDRYSSSVHPVRVYAGGDLSLVYLMKVGESRASARCLVWREKKIYGRIYGDSARLEKALDAMGYNPGGSDGGLFEGARISKIWDPESERYACPYLDGYEAAVDLDPADTTGHLVIAKWLRSHEKPCRGFVYGSESGSCEPYRWCPKTMGWRTQPLAFARMHGESEDWSLPALETHGVQVPHPETGETVWWPKADLIRLGGQWRFKADVSDRYFVSDYSHAVFDNAELHVLEDGRKVSKAEFRRYGFTCAGSGRTYFGERERYDVGSLVYSFTWLRDQASARGIDVFELTDRLERGGDMDRETPRRRGEFALGDRVWNVGGYGPSPGIEGVVVDVHPDSHGGNVGVRYPGWRGGHDCYGHVSGLSGTSECWYQGRHEIVLIEDADAPSIAA